MMIMTMIMIMMMMMTMMVTGWKCYTDNYGMQKCAQNAGNWQL